MLHLVACLSLWGAPILLWVWRSMAGDPGVARDPDQSIAPGVRCDAAAIVHSEWLSAVLERQHSTCEP